MFEFLIPFLIVTCLVSVCLQISNNQKFISSFKYTIIYIFMIMIVALSYLHHIIVFVEKFLGPVFAIKYNEQFWIHFTLPTIKLLGSASVLKSSILFLLFILIGYFYFKLVSFLGKIIPYKNVFVAIGIGLLFYSTIEYIQNPNLTIRRLISSGKKFYAPDKINKQSLIDHQFDSSNEAIKLETLRTEAKAKNIIVIYLEAFDQLYTDLHPNGFQALTPHLNQFAQKSIVFKEWYAADNYTFGAIFGTHCGTKLLPGGHLNYFFSDTHLENMVCVTDILNHAGFKNIFMGGANTKFSGKGQFLKKHGYNEVFGREHFQNNSNLSSALDKHALLDKELFEQALEKVTALHQSGDRFLFTLLTINTHFPGFSQKNCSNFKYKSSLLLGASCTDYAIGKFLAELEKNGILHDTALWIMSDHPQFNIKQKKEVFKSYSNNQKLVSILKLPLTEDKYIPIDEPTVGFDFAPTVLEILGVQTSGQFHFGRNLMNIIDEQSKLNL